MFIFVLFPHCCGDHTSVFVPRTAFGSQDLNFDPWARNWEPGPKGSSKHMPWLCPLHTKSVPETKVRRGCLQNVGIGALQGEMDSMGQGCLWAGPCPKIPTPKIILQGLSVSRRKSQAPPTPIPLWELTCGLTFSTCAQRHA